MPHDLLILPQAQEDLDGITEWVADVAGVDVALAYLARIAARCSGLTILPARGSARDDLLPGLRSVPFERGATIFYLAMEGQVRIVRVLRRGRNVTPAPLAP